MLFGLFIHFTSCSFLLQKTHVTDVVGELLCGQCGPKVCFCLNVCELTCFVPEEPLENEIVHLREFILSLNYEIKIKLTEQAGKQCFSPGFNLLLL